MPHVRVGHASSLEGVTGCTAVLFDRPAVASADIRGSAPGTKEMDALAPARLVPNIHGVCFAGGSAFGLAASDGVMRYLEEQGIGFAVGKTVVPIVPTAIIYDLGIGDAKVRPDAAMGYEAAQNASSVFAQGSVGAGTGATVGKLFGLESATKGGLGAGLWEKGEAIVGAMAVVNSFGDVLDEAGSVLAGARSEGKFVDMGRYFREGNPSRFPPFSHTTLVLVCTTVKLSKELCIKMASKAQDALCGCLSPCHTMVDGDVAICASVGDASLDTFVLAEAVKQAVQEAVRNAVRCAKSLGGVPALCDLGADR